MSNQATFSVLASALLLSSVLAVTLQLDVSESPQMNLSADWTDGDSGSDNSSQDQSVFNTG